MLAIPKSGKVKFYCFIYLQLSDPGQGHSNRYNIKLQEANIQVFLCLKSAFISIIKAHLSSDSNNSLCPKVQHISTTSLLHTQSYGHKSGHLAFHNIWPADLPQQAPKMIDHHCSSSSSHVPPLLPPETCSTHPHWQPFGTSGLPSLQPWITQS